MAGGVVVGRACLVGLVIGCAALRLPACPALVWSKQQPCRVTQSSQSTCSPQDAVPTPASTHTQTHCCCPVKTTHTPTPTTPKGLIVTRYRQVQTKDTLPHTCAASSIASCLLCCLLRPSSGMSSGGPVSTNMRLLWPNTNVSPTLRHDTHTHTHTWPCSNSSNRCGDSSASSLLQFGGAEKAACLCRCNCC